MYEKGNDIMATKNANKVSTSGNDINLTNDIDDILDAIDEVNVRRGGGGHTGDVEKNANEGFATLTETTRPELDDEGNKTGNSIRVFTLKCGHLADGRLLAKLKYDLTDGEKQALKDGVKYYTYKTAKGNEVYSRRETSDKTRVNVYDTLIKLGRLEELNVKYEH